MNLQALELHRISMPLVRPFETSFGRQTGRELLLVKAITDVGVGWGECVAMTEPVYSSEYVSGCEDVIREYLAPALFAATAGSASSGSAEGFAAASAARIMSFVIGHRMAKAAVETALLDAQTRADGVSFGQYFGATRDRVDCGVSVGISPTIAELLDEVSSYVEQGYKRIKLKIKPGWDVAPVAAVRELLGPEALLQVDANTAYTLDDVDQLRALDEFGLLLIEQPFVEEDIRSHVVLARSITTPVCLDESIVTTEVAIDALERRATTIINIKPGRVGGYLEAIAIHDACVERGVPVWCGGMLETGVGRAANIALAALPGFALPGDTSASNRYYAEDLTEPFVLVDGTLGVPTGPGSGVKVRDELLRDWAVRAPVVLRG